MKHHRGKAADRAGYALVLFVMIFFGLMGLAALVIDMGFARLTQQEMQTAVDSAALEGLRWRDFSTDQYRRQQASQMVASLFTNYVDPSGGTVECGAGPVVDFTGGVGPADLAAAQTMVVLNPPVYQPTELELNLSNGTAGDMSSGTYGSNPNYDATQLADEDANYNRRDFTLAPSGSSTGSAFLVRMRRTNNASGLDQESGVSSGGPTLPVLFGRGSLMARSGTGSQLSVTSGITVRATAIAAAGDGIQFGGTSYSAGRAKTAGRPFQQINQDNPAETVNIPGITPFALSQTNWQNGQTSFTLALDGSITLGGQIIQPALVEIGQQIAAGKSVTPQDAAWLAQYVSANGTNPANYTGPTLLALSQYVPVVDTNNTIIGFGYVQSWTWTEDATGATGGTLSITMGPSGSQPVGYGNVSGAFVPGLTQDTTDFTTLFQEHATLNNPLYAPVLVNHYIGPNSSNP